MVAVRANEKTERASRITAINDAKSELIARHQAEFDKLVDKYMAEAGFVKQEVVKTIWAKTPTSKRSR